MFIERWAKPYYDRCEQYGLEFTGHYWEHEWPNCTIVPDNMALAAWQHRPGIDTLMNRYQEHTHAQFGNVRAVREIASVANQLGRQRTLCEVYGAAGWDLRFQDMKRIADWLAVLGVNTFDEHLSYISLRGARKRDHPQSFSYHEPWWDSYHVIARYLSRISLALSHGNQVHRVLVLEPTTTAWMYNAGSHAAPQLDLIGDRFSRLLMSLEQHQIEYDLGCEDIIAQHGSVHDRIFRVGRRDYEIVVLPPHTENLNAPTTQLLQRFLDRGGHVLSIESNPTRIDGASSDTLTQLTAHRGWRLLSEADIVQELDRLSPLQDLAISRTSGDRGILFHHRRKLADGQLLFLVNTSDTQPSSGIIQANAGSLERWDPLTGEIHPYPWTPDPTGVQATFQLPPCGSLLLFCAHTPRKPPVLRRTQPGISLPPSGPVEVDRLGPNVLTLDFTTLAVGAEALTNAYFYRAAQFAFQRHGMNRNPWDSAVQFRDEIITATFPTNSGFTASYHFTILDTVPPNLEAVVERPDLYTIACNGTIITPSPGRWWLDRSFGRLALGHAARPGLNEVTLTATPFRLEHELEPVYILGSFALRPTTQGFAIIPDRPLQLPSLRDQTGIEAQPDPRHNGWNHQGHPFYAEGVSYRQSFNVKRKQAAYRVALGSWHGSVAKILVNRQLAGHIFAPPYDLDVTHLIRRGSNRIEVVVIGTLKNTLGPHHGNPPTGSAWPAMFQSGPAHGPPPGNQYHTLDCGLFEPFVVIETKAED
jgi:hypothetical protein